MNKLRSILLLFLMVIGTVGLYPMFVLLQMHTRSQVQQQLERNPQAGLVVFVNPENNKEILWEDEGEEFHYRGKMYDVVQVESKNGDKVYYCFSDQKESQIYSCIEDMVSRQLDNSNTPAGNANHHLLKMLTQTFLPGQQYLFIPSCFSGKTATGRSSSKAYRSCISEVEGPPPRFV